MAKKASNIKKPVDKAKLRQVRRCIGCGEHDGKIALMRIVKSPEGTVYFDRRGNANGRGAYVCSLKCLERAFKGNKLEKALKTDANSIDKQGIIDQICEHLGSTD